MVHTAAIVLVLAVLPFPFHSAGFVGEAIWGWCSGIGAVLMLVGGVAVSMSRRVPKGTFGDPGTSRLAAAYASVALLGALVLFAVNATGIGLERSPTPYLVAVLLLFGLPVVLFIRLLDTAIGPRRGT